MNRPASISMPDWLYEGLKKQAKDKKISFAQYANEALLKLYQSNGGTLATEQEMKAEPIKENKDEQAYIEQLNKERAEADQVL
jgi:hypothetical protein